ncbi:glycerol-3-phosphate dehydrogenase/oxidase [Ohtaekwangia koreensis]|uniref:Glycerol-3-phosphate dehydrogenase n=1 Tax=Ohtaekwangia koreensis TaxID=688867 RepID=A0A1T5IZP0_9BACT|nr:glycerol-3-phosphate dehydrogenase/oxidase [Ohtaekwangia koreensis]SKC44594.1 glycerol-3-phosphate dehydrogenase [Ohtaekwangia koreensis]
MNRPSMIEALQEQGSIPWDVLIIGGGATGLGAAVEAASRGLKTLLVEQHDFAKGTSSRSTKLIHGGVRYLQQGDIGLVLEALHERGLLRQNAPHLVRNQQFIIPNYEWWNGPFYTIGMKVYDMMSGSLGLGTSEHISKEETMEAIANLKEDGLRGGVIYYDGQFDDARLAINLAQTAVNQGGVVINYMKVTSLLKDAKDFVIGATAIDMESRVAHTIYAKSVINCTGVFADAILRMDDPQASKSIVPSQGVHIVLDREFLQGDAAIMIPKTSDGRVLFAVPWHDKVVVGTTDTLVENESLEPRALKEEIDFILNTASLYLTRKPVRSDVKSIFAGLRPLTASANGKATKEISRSHKILVSLSGLITVIGGKWTTYRKMGEDTIDRAIIVGSLPEHSSITKQLRIHGATDYINPIDPLYFYGSDKKYIEDLIRERPALAEKINPALNTIHAEVVWAAKAEMARTVEDVLARRTRGLFLDAAASIEMAPTVARLLADSLGYDEAWQREQIEEYTQLANGYRLL